MCPNSHVHQDSDTGSTLCSNYYGAVGLTGCSLNTSAVGTYLINFTVTDSAGLTASTQRVVVVYEPCPLGEYLCANKVGARHRACNMQFTSRHAIALSVQGCLALAMTLNACQIARTPRSCVLQNCSQAGVCLSDSTFSSFLSATRVASAQSSGPNISLIVTPNLPQTVYLKQVGCSWTLVMPLHLMD